MLDTVRTRILDFVLAIKAENPDAGESSPAAPPPIPQERLGDIFHVVVGQGAQVIIGNRGTATIATHPISPAIPGEKRMEVEALLSDLQSKLDLVLDEADKADAQDALVKLTSQLAKPKPDPARAQSYLQLYVVCNYCHGGRADRGHNDQVVSGNRLVMNVSTVAFLDRYFATVGAEPARRSDSEAKRSGH